MGKLVVTEYVTLDGVMDEPGEWSFSFWSEEGSKFKYDELFAADAQLLGRKTYEGFAKAWPTMEGTGDFGERMNGMPKYVVTKTLKNLEWTNSHVIDGNVPDAVAALKKQYAKDILVAGSATLVPLLAQHNLVDEYRLMVHPIVLGGGKRLLGAGMPKRTMKLLNTQSFGSGVVVLSYGPAPA
jgi:dihydrofolate reductase